MPTWWKTHFPLAQHELFVHLPLIFNPGQIYK